PLLTDGREHPTSPPFFFPLMLPPPPTSTLFPYTTLFRSIVRTTATATPATSGPPPNVVAWSPGFKAAAMPSVRSTAPIGSPPARDRKSTRLNSSHVSISYAVFCLKKKKQNTTNVTHISIS